MLLIACVTCAGRGMNVPDTIAAPSRRRRKCARRAACARVFCCGVRACVQSVSVPISLTLLRLASRSRRSSLSCSALHSRDHSSTTLSVWAFHRRFPARIPSHPHGRSLVLLLIRRVGLHRRSSPGLPRHRRGRPRRGIHPRTGVRPSHGQALRMVE